MDPCPSCGNEVDSRHQISESMSLYLDGELVEDMFWSVTGRHYWGVFDNPLVDEPIDTIYVVEVSNGRSYEFYGAYEKCETDRVAMENDLGEFLGIKKEIYLSAKRVQVPS